MGLTLREISNVINGIPEMRPKVGPQLSEDLKSKIEEARKARLERHGR